MDEEAIRKVDENLYNMIGIFRDYRDQSYKQSTLVTYSRRKI